MEKKQILTSPSLEELKKHGESGFPFQVYLEAYHTYSMETMNLHWHRELEFDIILSGTVLAQIDGILYEVPEGDAIFINSNVLHLTRAKFPGNHTTHASLVFAPEFLSPEGSEIFREEIEPVLRHASFRGYHLSHRILWQRELIRLLSEASYLHQHSLDGNKMKIHANLCSAWTLLTDALNCGTVSSAHLDRDLRMRERTRKMLSYIQEHFADPIRIEDIAAAAQVSRSECFRCFQKMVCQKPSEYLNTCRLTKAAQLLKETDLPILEVSTRCGFNYQSYFGKKFAECYGMTPAEYRRGQT